jgi:Valyl-tRNA synthetase
MAPIVPFVTDYVWAVLRTVDDPDSVHLASWPAPDQDLIDERLSTQMHLVRRLVELGRSARAPPRSRSASRWRARWWGRRDSRISRRNCGTRSRPSSTCARWRA